MLPTTRYQIGDKLIGGRYLVFKVFRGGMSEVYLCVDMVTKKPYALKTFKESYISDRLLENLAHEIVLWISLGKHANIVQCFQSKGEALSGGPVRQTFMLLEMVSGDPTKGIDLRHWLNTGPIDMQTAIQFAIDICNGLVYARSKLSDVVHRDLKPENIMVTHDHIAKITDWGLAKIVQQSGLQMDNGVGQTGLAGTPRYMAPEQWLGEYLDCRTDIYALGCILYEMLTGQQAFNSMTLASLKWQHINSMVDLSDNRLSIVRTVLTRCLAKNRDERFANPEELLSELSRIYHKQFSNSPRISTSDELSPLDYTLIADTYTKLGLFEEAYQMFSKAIALDPSPEIASFVFYCRGYSYIKQSQWYRALIDLTKAICLQNVALQVVHTYTFMANPGQSHLAMASVVGQLGTNYTELMFLFLEKAVRLGAPVNDHLRGKIKVDDSELDKILAKFLGEFPSKAQKMLIAETMSEQNMKKLNDFLVQGADYFDSKRFKKSIESYTRALEIAPDFVSIYRLRADAFEQVGQIEDAILDYNKAASICIQPAISYYRCGNLHLQQENYSEAISAYTYAIAINPAFAEAYSNRGGTYRLNGDYALALKDLNRALELMPDDAISYNHRGHVLVKLGDFEAARADLMKAAKAGQREAVELLRRLPLS